ncbi:hypothetical protein EU534_00090 [Candidatus Heimdallarchaeota archaeon]|nr:MAG: hypothetical protein EU534_00090 [Candidatus Heimdallarchaeota archaeon]
MVLIIVNGIYAISAGSITAFIWIFVLLKKLGSRFIENKSERIFHITAEFLMSIVAIIAGILLLLNETWGIYLFYLAMGLVLYASVNAIGIYREKYKMLVIVLAFTAVITLTLTALSIALLSI